MFARQAGIDIVHVPYKGANDVAKDFVAGRVHLQFASSSAAVALAKTGEIRMLAAVAPARSALFPELATMSEQGISGVDIGSWIGFVGPAGMDPKTTARLSEAIAQVLAMPKVRDEFLAGGVEAQWLGPQAFADDADRALEASGVADGEELLGVGAAALAAHLGRRAQIDLEDAVTGPPVPCGPASGYVCLGGVEDLGHLAPIGCGAARRRGLGLRTEL